MKNTRLAAQVCLAASLLVCGVPALAADSYPSRPIKIIVAYPAGGANDIVARTAAEEISKDLGQTVIVENISGAAGTLGAARAAKSAPDGYTLFMAAGAHALAPSVRKNLSYDIIKDFDPVSIAAIGTYVLVVNPAVKATSVRELIDLAKARPEELTFASSGVGAPLHLAGVLFQEKTQTQLRHVPFRGDADANTAVAAGHVDMIFGSLGPMLPFIHSGKVRALAVTSAARSTVADTLPTLMETGVPDYSIGTWWGLLAPAGTDQAIVDRLAKSMANAAANPAIQDRFKSMGAEAASDTPAEFRDFIAQEVQQYSAITKAAKIEPMD
ncbi:tripartite tricarboxylate transporter substrate binding protein [Bordetella sp. BOR01]|uniref:Bug family tripartite tricarboxylate transporter substrate binding protein n=1 Tax=Bordetella sp. BOR01 TaxID=2854779 RepID=UPI001C484F32|nr:tripartite tricarboxylate transporter substrate binding protein [Bordetella sp. BOR01]MBV7484828.1 tripartite tricarboxylate transporter substrate binding protein [Bordetella sp. BOR01]